MTLALQGVHCAQETDLYVLDHWSVQGAFFYCSALKMIKCQPEGNLNTVPPQKMTKNETS